MAMPAFQTLASTATIRVSSRAMSCLVANCSLIGMASAAARALSSAAPRVNQRIVDFDHHDSRGTPQPSPSGRHSCASCFSQGRKKKRHTPTKNPWKESAEAPPLRGIPPWKIRDFPPWPPFC